MSSFFDLNDAEFCEAYAEEAFIADVQYEISRLLKGSGVSRSELARRMGVSAPYITQMMSEDGANITLKTVARVFKALGQRPLLSHRPAMEIGAGCVDVVGDGDHRDLTEISLGIEWHQLQQFKEMPWEDAGELSTKAPAGADAPDAWAKVVKLEDYRRAA